MRTQKHFARYRAPRIEAPNLVAAQMESFKWVLEHGIKDIFKEFTPIRDYS
jgi:DNA-directed RNA polymerase subunit beta